MYRLNIENIGSIEFKKMEVLDFLITGLEIEQGNIFNKMHLNAGMYGYDKLRREYDEISLVIKRLNNEKKLEDSILIYNLDICVDTEYFGLIKFSKSLAVHLLNGLKKYSFVARDLYEMNGTIGMLKMEHVYMSTMMEISNAVHGGV